MLERVCHIIIEQHELKRPKDTTLRNTRRNINEKSLTAKEKALSILSFCVLQFIEAEWKAKHVRFISSK